MLKLIVYVNCNSEAHKISKANKWIWSSYLDLIGCRNGTLCNNSLMREEFKNSIEFLNFCNQVLPDIIEDKEIKESLLE